MLVVQSEKNSSAGSCSSAPNTLQNTVKGQLNVSLCVSVHAVNDFTNLRKLRSFRITILSGQVCRRWWTDVMLPSQYLMLIRK